LREPHALRRGNADSFMFGDVNAFGSATKRSAPLTGTTHFVAYQRRLIPIVGHDFPQETPNETASAILELLRSTT